MGVLFEEVLAVVTRQTDHRSYPGIAAAAFPAPVAGIPGRVPNSVSVPPPNDCFIFAARCKNDPKNLDMKMINHNGAHCKHSRMYWPPYIRE